MSAFKIFTLLFIAAGAGVMLVSALNTRRIIRRLENSRYASNWKVLAFLMILFLVGYIGAAFLLLFDFTELVLLLTGAVFFFGALFVLLVVRSGYLTIEEDHAIKTDLKRHGDRVERQLKDKDLQVHTTEARYKLLVENSGLPILYIGAGGTLFFANEDAARLMGRSVDKLVGMRIAEIIPRESGRILAGIRRAARTPGGEVFEVEVPTDAGRRWFLAVCRPIHSAGEEVIAVQVVAQDITDRRRAEQEIREQKEIYDQILDNMGVELALFDRDLRYEYINPRSIKDPGIRAWLIGRTNLDFTRRKRWDDSVAHERDESMRRAFEEGREIRFEEENQTSSGEIRNTLRVHSPIFNRAGEPIKIVGQGIDITEEKRVQNEMSRARDLAEESSRAKSEFLTNMSHEIRTPLNAVLGMGELLAETNLSAEQKRFVDTSRKAGENLLSLINDILDLSRIESGRLEVESIPFSTHELVLRSIAGIEDGAREKGLEFRQEIDSAVPAYLRGDPVRLRQILGNLVSNAVKFTEEGSVVLSIRAGTPTHDALPLVFSVSDTGPGIPMTAQASIFESFVQADSSTTRRFGGTGLGLAICKRLADLLDGRIELNSTPGQGSTFSLILSMPAAREEELKQKDKTTLPVGDSNSQLLRILLAEDNPDNQMLIQAYVKNFQCDLRLAANGQEALDHFQKESFDLVLLDMQMPVMDGYTTAARMRQFEVDTARSRTPIVALTAHALKEEEEKCLRAGCDRHVAKPIRKSVLLDLLTEFRQ